MSEQIPQRQTSLHITQYLFGPSCASRAVSPNNTHTHTHWEADRTHADGRCQACLRQLGSAGPRGQRTPLRCFCSPMCTGRSWLSGSAAERDKRSGVKPKRVTDETRRSKVPSASDVPSQRFLPLSGTRSVGSPAFPSAIKNILASNRTFMLLWTFPRTRASKAGARARAPEPGGAKTLSWVDLDH